MKPANDNASLYGGRNPTTDELETWAKAVINELRERGRAVGIGGDRAHHADATRAVESLASSARIAELIRRAEPANDTGE